jgi:hypothetical protein
MLPSTAGREARRHIFRHALTRKPGRRIDFGMGGHQKKRWKAAGRKTPDAETVMT